MTQRYWYVLKLAFNLWTWPKMWVFHLNLHSTVEKAHCLPEIQFKIFPPVGCRFIKIKQTYISFRIYEWWEGELAFSSLCCATDRACKVPMYNPKVYITQSSSHMWLIIHYYIPWACLLNRSPVLVMVSKKPYIRFLTSHRNFSRLLRPPANFSIKCNGNCLNFFGW